MPPTAEAARLVSSWLVRGGAFVRNARGFMRAGLAAAAGAGSALAFAPFGIFPLYLIGVAILVLLLDGAATKRRAHLSAAWVGWCWGFGQFLVGLYWVGYAFLVEAAAHAWQIPLVEFFLPGGLALFIAFATFAASFYWKQGVSRVFVLAIAYGIAEWLRGHVFTGFPWNLPAYAWGASLGVLQSTALIGSYGLSLLTILFGASLAAFAESEPRAWRAPLCLTALFALLWIGGDVRLALTHPDDVPGVRLRLVQPNVPQREKISRAYWTRNWQSLIALSNRPAAQAPTIIVWPEAAPPYVFIRVPAALEEIAALTGTKRVLMTGAVRVFRTGDGELHGSNSLYIFGPEGVLLSTYDKFHLVPFGEYLPLADLLERLGLRQVVDGPGGFTPGDGPHTFSIPGAPPVGPLICYEIIFPGEVVGAKRPDWFVNVTDDSWFGPWTGPSQHLLIARVRAIEEGIPVARDANTGISAVIDALGRIRASLGLGQSGVVDSPLPKAVPKTVFARFGDSGFCLLLLTLIGGVWQCRAISYGKGDKVLFATVRI
jgi:apolipoprotein N-acyltransferase